MVGRNSRAGVNQVSRFSSLSASKNTDEVYLDLMKDYRRLNPGGFRAEDIGVWIEMNELLPKPKVSASAVHAKKLKDALRRKRVHDAKYGNVREWIAAKIEHFTENSQMVMDVIWDHIYEMSLDHALTAFQQRDEIITKQRRAATRCVESCLDNNPNVKGHRELFLFQFMDEAPVAVVEERISESAFQSNPLPDNPSGPHKPR